jgi:hypothetical protein
MYALDTERGSISNTFEWTSCRDKNPKKEIFGVTPHRRAYRLARKLFSMKASHPLVIPCILKRAAIHGTPAIHGLPNSPWSRKRTQMTRKTIVPSRFGAVEPGILVFPILGKPGKSGILKSQPRPFLHNRFGDVKIGEVPQYPFNFLNESL